MWKSELNLDKLSLFCIFWAKACLCAAIIALGFDCIVCFWPTLAACLTRLPIWRWIRRGAQDVWMRSNRRRTTGVVILFGLLLIFQGIVDNIFLGMVFHRWCPLVLALRLRVFTLFAVIQLFVFLWLATELGSFCAQFSLFLFIIWVEAIEWRSVLWCFVEVFLLSFKRSFGHFCFLLVAFIIGHWSCFLASSLSSAGINAILTAAHTSDQSY